MKRVLSLLLAALMLTGMLVSCQETPAAPADTTDPTETTETPADTTEAPETEPPVPEKQPYEEAIVREYDGYTVTLEAPIAVFHGKEGDDAWGHTNFPSVSRTKEGYLMVSWMYGEDKVGAKSNVTYRKVSMNEGKSWLPLNVSVSFAPPDKVMPNGKCWNGFVGGGTPTSKELAALIPDSEKVTLEDGKKLIFAEDLAKYDLAGELNLTGLKIREYDPETGTAEIIDCTLNWPYAPVTLYPGDIFYSVGGAFTLSGSNVILAKDGTLYTCIYMYGFDSTADSREEAVNDYVKRAKFHVYVFASSDSGRTWDFLSQLTPGEEVEDPYATGFEGYCEPKMIEMPDGSFVMMLRSGGYANGTCPMYITRSTDGCHTWTTPEVFDYCGVLPQLLLLDCGVAITSYGRPDLFICTTDDPSGADWDEHIEIPLSSDSPNFMQKSCFYTSLLKIDENSAWLAYTDFKYPNKDGVPVKSVMLRKITVTVNE